MTKSLNALALSDTELQVVALSNNPHMNICGSNNYQNIGKIQFNQPINPLSQLLNLLDIATDDSAELLAISDELKTYFSERDVIGLKEKLVNAGREDLLEDAIYEKHRFSLKLASLQFSLQLRRVYHHILSMLVQRFRGGVLPLIHNGASFPEVDAAVMNLVSEVYSYTSASKTLNLTETDIHAMVFFLTGNCHLRWNK